MKCITCKTDMTYQEADLYFCSDCKLISSSLEPDLTIYDRSYDIKYNRYSRTEAGKKIGELRKGCVRRHVFQTNGRLRLLDFGCGSGSFIDSFFENDIVATGYDVNPHGYYNDISVLFGKYEILTFWDCLEHLKDPKKIIKSLNPIYVFVCTPSTDDWKEKTEYRKEPKNLTKWRHYMPYEHRHYFNECSLKMFLKSCNYEILEVNYDESGPRPGGGDKNILTIAAKRTGYGAN